MQLTLFFTITCNPPLCYIKGNIIQSVQVYQAMSASIKSELTNASLHYICISLQNYTVVHRNTGCCRPQLPVFQDFAGPLLGGLFLLSVWIRTDTKNHYQSRPGLMQKAISPDLRYSGQSYRDQAQWPQPEKLLPAHITCKFCNVLALAEVRKVLQLAKSLRISLT